MLGGSASMEAATSGTEAAGHVLHAGDLEIRPDEFTALVRGRPLALTVRELQLLTALAERQGRIVSRAELYSVVWGEPYRKADRSVDVYVGKLRQKLASAVPGCRFIHTHFGFGYRFTPFSQERHSSITDSR
jgi:DNA-binding response OmpR family regulator